MASCAAVTVALAFILFRESMAQVIFQPPTNITVFQDQSPAVFECVTNGGLSGWRVNGTIYGSLPAELRSDLDTESRVSDNGEDNLRTLTIPARAKYNGTRVQCVTIMIGGNTVESEIVTMEVQGILSSVTDLTVTWTTTSITTSWSAPFSLDVTGVDPDIWYSVLIYNVTDNPTAIPCTDCMDITETHYTFTPDYPSPCHKYIFTVIPLNGAGQGHNSSVTGYTAPEPPSDVHLGSDDIIEIDEDDYTAIVNFLGDIENVCTYTLRVVDLDISFNSVSQFANGTVVFKVPVIDVDPHREYEVFFEVSNPAGSIRTPSITFKTSACQQTMAYINGKEISIRGDLATSSPVQGCFIFLGGDVDECYALQRNNDRVYHQANDTGFESVCIYDIKEDGLPSSFPALAMKLDDSHSHETIQPTPSQNSTTPDILLIGAGLSRNGDQVSISCELTSEASCVLVYQSNHTTLSVKEYIDFTTFPVSLTVDEDTTLFLFGKNGALQQEPVLILRKGDTHVVYESRNMDDDNTNDVSTTATVTGTVVVGVVVCVVIVCVVIACVAVVLLLKKVMKRPRNRGKVDHDTDERGVSSSMLPASSESTSDSGDKSSDSGIPENEGNETEEDNPDSMSGSNEVEEALFPATDFMMPVAEHKIFSHGDSEVVAGDKGQTPPTDKRVDETRGDKVPLSGGGENTIQDYISAPLTMEHEVLCDDDQCVPLDWESGEDDDENGNTETGSCVESVTCSEEEKEEEEAHVFMLGGATHSISIFGKCCVTYVYYEPLAAHHGTCVLDDECSHELSGLSVVEDEVNAVDESEQKPTVTAFDFVCSLPRPRIKPLVHKEVCGREFISGIGPVTLAACPCAHFSGHPANDRATEQATVDNSVTLLNNISHFEGYTDLPLQMRPEFQETDDEGADVYREMIFPSIYSRHCIFEQGMMVTGMDSAEPSENDEVTPDLPDIHPFYITTPTPPHPPLPEPKDVTASAEEMPSQKPQWSHPPDNLKEKVQKWFYTGIALGFNGPGNKLFFQGLPSHS